MSGSLRINKPALGLICLSQMCFFISTGLRMFFIINVLLFGLFCRLVTVTHISTHYESPGA